MLVYRIVLAKYAEKLVASGRAARWNPNDVEMIYTASSRSLACLENVVHRDEVGLSRLFSILTIDVPDHIKIETISAASLPQDWTDFSQMRFTQHIGENWVKKGLTAILKVPSSIVEQEINYLINPHHTDFEHIRLIKSQPFIFDRRIKQ